MERCNLVGRMVPHKNWCWKESGLVGKRCSWFIERIRVGNVFSLGVKVNVFLFKILVCVLAGEGGFLKICVLVERVCSC